MITLQDKIRGSLIGAAIGYEAFLCTIKTIWRCTT